MLLVPLPHWGFEIRPKKLDVAALKFVMLALGPTIVPEKLGLLTGNPPVVVTVVQRFEAGS